MTTSLAPSYLDNAPLRRTMGGAPLASFEKFSDTTAVSMDTVGNGPRVVDVVPVRLDDEGLMIQTRNGEKRIPFSSIQKMALAAIRGAESEPFLLLDLILKGKKDSERILRFTTLAFNPMKLVPSPGSPKDALLQMVKILKHFSGAEALPNEDALAGHPFSVFENVAAFENGVYAS